MKGLDHVTSKPPPDFSRYELQELEQFVHNYNRMGDVHGDDFAALLQAREGKRADRQEPDLYRSLDLLKTKACSERFVSYGELAEASGLTWTHTLRARMSGSKGHLDRLLDLCRSKRLPLLTAICVNKENLVTGKLEVAALAGFTTGARRLGHNVGNEQAFLSECQEQCFRWGREQTISSGAVSDCPS